MTPTDYSQAVDELTAIVKQAFIDELIQISVVNGGIPPWSGDLEKFASSSLVDELVKEAIGAMLRGMGQSVLGAGKNIRQAVIGRQVGGAGGFRVGGMLPNPMGTGKRIEQAGAGMQQTIAGRLKNQGLKTNPAELGQLQTAAKAMGRGDPGLTKRVAGEAVQTAGQHISHANSLGLALNPIGTAIGGGIEGATRGVGRELVKSTGAAGAVGAGGIRGSIGRGMQQHAGKAGFVGELGTIGAMGGLAHLPFSGAGILGGGLAKASPLVSGALAAGGDVINHIGGDAIGSTAMSGLRHAGRFAGKAVNAGSRFFGGAA